MHQPGTVTRLTYVPYAIDLFLSTNRQHTFHCDGLIRCESLHHYMQRIIYYYCYLIIGSSSLCYRLTASLSEATVLPPVGPQNHVRG
jgi:hypothetical protein